MKLRWLRGKADIVLRGKEAILEMKSDNAEEYVLDDQMLDNVLADLFLLGLKYRPTFSDSDNKILLKCVRKYGLLYSGLATQIKHGEALREEWKYWVYLAVRVSVVLQLRMALFAIDQGGPRDSGRGYQTILYIADKDSAQPQWLESYAAKMIEKYMNELLSLWEKECEINNTPMLQMQSQHMNGEINFQYAFRTWSLWQSIVYRLAQFVTSTALQLSCEYCRRPFAPKDRRQRYCSKKCTSRATSKRYDAKGKTDAAGIEPTSQV